MFVGRIIGLSGKAGAGKSTVAKYLEKQHNFQRIRFADTIKNMLRVAGLSDAHIEGDLKEKPCELLCGKTPRQAMQSLGSEWGRHMIGEDFWVRLWAARAAQYPLVVVEDVRFDNEAATIRNLGGIIIQIECPWSGSASGGGHASEVGVVPDFVVHNDQKDDVGPLHAQVLDVLWRTEKGGISVGECQKIGRF